MHLRTKLLTIAMISAKLSAGHIKLAPNASLELEPAAAVKILSNSGVIRLSALFGSLQASTQNQAIELRTPSAKVRAKDAEFALNITPELTQITCIRGTLRLLRGEQISSFSAPCKLQIASGKLRATSEQNAQIAEQIRAAQVAKEREFSYLNAALIAGAAASAAAVALHHSSSDLAPLATASAKPITPPVPMIPLEPAKPITPPPPPPPSGDSAMRPTPPPPIAPPASEFIPREKYALNIYTLANLREAVGTQASIDPALTMAQESDYLYDENYLDEQKLASMQKLFFPDNWAADVEQISLVAGINDGGVAHNIAPGFSGYYSYVGARPDLANRANVLQNPPAHKEYSQPYAKTPEGQIVSHGEEVAYVILRELPQTKFVNLLDPTLNASDKIDLAASVDMASAKGVKFFNRSLATTVKNQGFLDASLPNISDFEPAISAHDALVINAAGNQLQDAKYTPNSLEPNSPLKSNWIIVTGFSGISEAKIKAKSNRTEPFYAIIGNKMREIYPFGNSCKQIGVDDCISAPFFAVINPSGKLGMGTSFSAPMVTAAAMAVKAKFPFMSANNIKQTLFSTATAVSAGKNDPALVASYFGAGLINPVAALQGPAEFKNDFLADVWLDDLFAFSNEISGSGGLIKRGAGTLALRANNTFSGDILLQNGGLWLLGKNAANAKTEPGTTLRMSANASVLDLQNAGVLVSSGFSARNLELAASSVLYASVGDLITVANEAKLAGELEFMGMSNNFLPENASEQIPVISAAQLSGEFSQIGYDKAFLSVQKAIYSPQQMSVQISPTMPMATAFADEYASKNYASLFKSFNHLAASQNRDELTASQNRDAALQNRDLQTAAWLQNLSLKDAALLAPQLFAAKATPDAALALAGARALMMPSQPGFGAFFAQSKFATSRRDLSGLKISAPLASWLSAQAAIAQDSAQNKLFALGANAELAAGSNASILLNASIARDFSAAKYSALNLAAGLKFAQHFDNGFYLNEIFNAEFNHLHASAASYLPASTNAANFSALSASAELAAGLAAGRFNASIQAGLRANERKKFHFSGRLMGAQIYGGGYLQPQTSALAKAQIEYALSPQAAISAAFAGEFAKDFSSQQAKINFVYRF